MRRKLPFIVVASLVFTFVFAGMALASGFTVTLDPVQVGVPRPDALTVSGTVSSGGTGVAGVPVTLKVTTVDGNIIGVEQVTSGPDGRFSVVLVMPAGVQPGDAVVTAAAGGSTAEQTVSIPLLPAAYYGTVTDASGQSVSAGKVEAYIGLQKCGEIDFANGFYGGSDPKLVVTGTESDEGLPVTFKVVVDGKAYDATPYPEVTWQPGDVRRVDLTVAAAPQPPQDTNPPAVDYTDPTNNATNVPVNKTITVTFSEDVQAGDNYGSITVKNAAGNTVAVTKSISGKVLTIRPNTYFAYSTRYTVAIPAGAVKDMAGNALANEYAFSFTTQAASGGGGGGGGSTSVNRVEKAVSATSNTVAEIADRVRVEIPAGAVTGTNPSLVAELLSDSKAQGAGMSLISRVVDISLKNGTLDGQITIVLYYDKGKLGSNEEPVAFYYDEDKAQWVRLDGTVDSTKGTVTVAVDHLTMFAVFAVAKQEKQEEQPQPPQPTPVVTFKDMAGHWAEATVVKLAGIGVINGYEDGTFRPNNKITRAEIASILVRALNLQAADESALAFADGGAIPEWARGAVAAAVENGLVKGYPVPGGVEFRASNPITRAELAAILSRVLEDRLGKITGQPVQFADSAKIPAWAKDAVNTAAAAGVVGGYQDGTFRAQNNVTRAEAASMILRLLEKIE